MKSSVGQCGMVSIPQPDLLPLVDEVQKVVDGVGYLVLRVRISGPNGEPSLHLLSGDLCHVFSVGGFVHGLAVLSGTNHCDPVEVDSPVSQLRQQLRRKHHRCNISSIDQVHFPPVR